MISVTTPGQLQQIARNWSAEQKFFSGGFVVIVDGVGRGWRSALAQPENFQPNTYFVALANYDIYTTVGGSVEHGAEAFKQLNKQGEHHAI